MSDKHPVFSVIIPTCNRSDHLSRCLDCLIPGRQTIDFDLYEVIVTDDSVQSESKILLEKHYTWAKWVAGPQKGPAANRNNGAGFASGKWLIFADDDCLPDSCWLEGYQKAMRHFPEEQVFEGKTYADRPKRAPDESAPVNETGGWLWSCNFAIKRELFENLEGFNEIFPYAAMEDVDLRYKLIKAGLTFTFVPEAGVCHPWRSEKGVKKLKQQIESQLIYLYLHPEEASHINSRTYLFRVLWSLAREVVPGIMGLQWRGVLFLIIKNWLDLKMAFRLRNFVRTRKVNGKI